MIYWAAPDFKADELDHWVLLSWSDPERKGYPSKVFWDENPEEIKRLRARVLSRCQKNGWIIETGHLEKDGKTIINTLKITLTGIL